MQYDGAATITVPALEVRNNVSDRNPPSCNYHYNFYVLIIISKLIYVYINILIKMKNETVVLLISMSQAALEVVKYDTDSVVVIMSQIGTLLYNGYDPAVVPVAEEIKKHAKIIGIQARILRIITLV